MQRSRGAGARARAGVRRRERLGGRGHRRGCATPRGCSIRCSPAPSRCRRTASGSDARSAGCGRCCRSPRPICSRRCRWSIRSASMAASPAVHGAALVAHDVGPICEARAFDVACRGEATLEGGLAALQALLFGAPGDVRRRSPRAPDARRGRRPARARRRRSRAAARRDHRLPPPAVGGLGGGAGRGAGARRASRRTSARRPRA